MEFGKAALALAFVAAVQYSTASAATLFEDPFDLDPDANGWTETINQGSDTINLADIHETGAGEVIFETDYDGTDGADNEFYAITRTLDATGFSSLAVKLSIREATTVEGSDNVKVQIDTGSGFTDVVGVSGEFGTTTLGPTFLGAATNNNSSFQIRVISNNNAEDIYLDHFIVYEFTDVVLYSDDFSLDADANGSTDRVGFTNGWTVEQGNVANGFTALTDGDEVVLARSTVDTSPDADDYIQLTHNFDTTGYSHISIQFDARQTGTTWESDDSLQILYTTDGVNYQTLLSDGGVWNPAGETNAGGTGNTGGAFFGPYQFTDYAVFNNPDFGIRIVGSFNADVEQYLLNSILLTGIVIPAPAALPAGLMLMGLLAGRRRA
ncbi:hypothetical protein HED60_18465 [Planctomycetales bacterium ZRK34]|nr:hypothetical protein HED60_18465 [Planctomycetales bacterium ZRK34]